MATPIQPPPPGSNRVRIVVATSVMLTFISYWRAAAIVLNDLGSSAFYAGGIAEKAVGKSAPWFILGVMVFAGLVRMVYVESCSMFVRGGVYRVVKEALGARLAKVSVSALMFDYSLTGPISGVSAGHYIAGLLKELAAAATSRGLFPVGANAVMQREGFEAFLAVIFAVMMTLYYWRQNIKGIEESSERALNVMKVVTVMVVILLGWSFITLLKFGGELPPAPVAANLDFSNEALGFLQGTDWWKAFGLFGILMAFGHSVLAMSGEESLAQVNREIAHPKLLNLKRAAVIIGIFSFLFTGVGTLLAVMIVPDDVRIPVYGDNLMAGLAMHLWGPDLLKVIFRAFVVVVGFLMLSGAINTSIIGLNGVLNRVSEDGVLTDWFRRPHKKFGTSYRIINMVVGLQLFTILASRGDVFILGEAYAFGVIMSFTFNSLSMLVLRYKYKGPRGWKMPPNITIAGVEIPIGLGFVFLVLFSILLTNLLTKRIATIAGLVFTGTYFLIFTISERINRRKFAVTEQQMKEHFQLLHEETVHRDAVGVRPGCIVVSVRDYNTLTQLKWVLERTDTEETDVVVMAARLQGAGSGEYDLAMEQIFSDYEQTLFTRAVAVAESYGKHVSLLVVPARDPWSAIVQTANALEASAVIAGLSTKMTAQEQAFNLGRAWEAMPEPKRQFVLQVVRPDMEVETFRIGPHNPELRSEDVLLVHKLWLDITRRPKMDELHHWEIVAHALTRYARDFARDPQDILKELHRTRDRRFGPPTIEGGGAAGPTGSTPPPGRLGPASGDERARPGAKLPSPDEDEEPPTPPVIGP